MVICPDCKKDVPNAKFCKNCGARLPDVEEIQVPVVDEVTEVKQEGSVGSSNVKFCHKCGHELGGEFKFCPNCGAGLNNSTSQPKVSVLTGRSGEKNILLAIVFSVIFPGLGQIYLRLDKKGAYFLIGYVISLVLCLFIIGFILCLIIWIWALVDAIQSTNALNSGQNVEDKLF